MPKPPAPPPPRPKLAGPPNELVSNGGQVREKPAPEHHASAVSDALERIERIERRMDSHIRYAHHSHPEEPDASRDAEALFVDMKKSFEGGAPRPDPSVRAPLARIETGMPRDSCRLCRQKFYSLLGVGPWLLCDGCVSKLEAALGVGG